MKWLDLSIDFAIGALAGLAVAYGLWCGLTRTRRSSCPRTSKSTCRARGKCWEYSSQDQNAVIDDEGCVIAELEGY